MTKSRAKVADLPEAIKAYRFHGLDFTYRKNMKDVVCDCPFCGKEQKFSINVESGVWRCFSCSEGSEKGGGNAYTFIRSVHAQSVASTDQAILSDFGTEKGLMTEDSLLQWGVCQSVVDGSWLLPAYSPDGKLNQLYRYVHMGAGKYRALATPGMSHCLFGGQLYNAEAETIYLTEGLWDGVALWETLGQTKRVEGHYEYTQSPRRSIQGKSVVFGIPGCEIFRPEWVPLFAGKHVVVLYDNDHPREHPKTKQTIAPASVSGMHRVVKELKGSETPPREIVLVNWEDFQKGKKRPTKPSPDLYTTHLAPGFDLRDAFCQAEGPAGRVAQFALLMKTLTPPPILWIEEAEEAAENKRQNKIGCKPCDKWKVLRTSWRKAMRWTEGLDRGLSVMLASIVSTRQIGDQLWVKIIGPASCGKSTLCEAISVSPHIMAKSTIRGFHSGMRGEDGEDISLISQVSGKTLVTKDGDTLLQSPNLSQILAEGRDVYDTTSRTHYRNNTGRDYSGIRMTWILCGTASLRSIDSSELGERFLDCVIMDGIDDELEDEILWRVANRAERNVSMESTEEVQSQQEPEMLRAMQLTGGYIDYLRKNAGKELEQVEMGDIRKHQCTRLGKFVAFMRARPSKLQEETAEREFAARLVSQLVRLTKCMAVVLNQKTVDDETMRRVAQVAFDTGRGKTMEIVGYLYEHRDTGLSEDALETYLCMRGKSALRKILKFLSDIGVAKREKGKKIKGRPYLRARWNLTPSLVRLYEEVQEIAQESRNT